MDYKRYSLCNNQITRIMSTRILFPLKQCLKLLHFIQLFIIPIVNVLFMVSISLYVRVLKNYVSAQVYHI